MSDANTKNLPKKKSLKTSKKQSLLKKKKSNAS